MPTQSDISIPIISGPGTYDIEVVGESNYQKHLIKICGPYCVDGKTHEAVAHLTLEDTNKFDKKAVMVVIDGGTIGYLDRETAREFRKAIKSGGLTEYTVFQCSALIRGGWDRGNGDRGSYGVTLDLPDDEDDGS